MKRVLPVRYVCRPPPEDRPPIVSYPCPSCWTRVPVYEGKEPRGWHRRPDGRLECGQCYRKVRRAEARKAKRTP